MKRESEVGKPVRSQSDSAMRKSKCNNYVRPPNTRTKTYAGRVACCSLLSHVEYVPRAIKDGKMRRALY